MNYALIPAAGRGTRIGEARPKQYCDVAGRPMICHALETLALCPEIARVFVVVAPHDPYVASLPLSAWAKQRVEVLFVGAESRQASVEQGLLAIAAKVDPKDWVLVHDAARPGLMPDLVARLIAAVEHDLVGGLLALPVADTLKRCASEHAPRSVETVQRERLWQAQTPQMFRHGQLLHALSEARSAGRLVTDEASAIEMQGLGPLLVPGHALNFKVTFPDDLQLADQLLRAAS